MPDTCFVAPELEVMLQARFLNAAVGQSPTPRHPIAPDDN